MAQSNLGYRLRKPHWPGRLVRLQLFCFGISCLATAVATGQEPEVLPTDDTLIAEEDVRRYTVELIVFSYDDSVSSGTEVFIPDAVADPVETVQPGVSDAGPLDASREPIPAYLDSSGVAQPGLISEKVASEDEIPTFGDFVYDLEDEEVIELIAADSIDLKVLMPDELTMIDIHEKLVLLDSYRPVMWAGWTQAMRVEEETPFIHLRRLGNIPLDFEGNVKLYLSRFLHLIVDIKMDGESPLPDESNANRMDSRFDRRYRDTFSYPTYTAAPTPELHYQIFENRIMKNEDIRYFDHPKFGVIAKVTRYEKPEEDDVLEDEEGLDVALDRAVLDASLSRAN